MIVKLQSEDENLANLADFQNVLTLACFVKVRPKLMFTSFKNFISRSSVRPCSRREAKV